MIKLQIDIDIYIRIPWTGVPNVTEIAGQYIVKK